MQGENKSLFKKYINKKTLFGFILLAGAALSAYFILSGKKNAAGDYLTDKVKRGSITTSISASGMVEPVKTVSLGFKNSEIVQKIYIKVGDPVKPGQILAELVSSNLEASLRQVEASLESQTASKNTAQASYELAKATLERNQALYESSALSKVDLDKANVDFINSESNLKQAIAQIKNTSAQLQLAQDDLSGARMVSPIEGIVSSVNGAEGQRSTANNNSTSSGGFIEVISEALQVRAQVNEGDIGRTQVGQQVEFSVNSFPDKKFSGRVSSISPKAYTESNVQIYDVHIELSEKYGELKAGMPANVNIIVERQENVLTIPKGAVTYAVNYMNKMRQDSAKSGSAAGTARQGQPQAGGQEGNGQGVNVTGGQSTSGVKVEDKEGEKGKGAVVLVMGEAGVPEPRRVRLGLSDLKGYEVISGLNEGETVIIGSLNQAAPSGGASAQGGNQTMPRVPGVVVR
ncbi:MAG: efflux RND transporter periplasmic adaptor subunit [Bacillota bacterium]